MSNLELAQQDYEFKNRRFKVSLVLLIAYCLVVLTVLAVQTFIIQSSIAENQKRNSAASEERFKRYTEANEEQHRRTQDFVLCIAKALLVPQSQRVQSAEACGIQPSKQSSSYQSSGVQLPQPILRGSPQPEQVQLPPKENTKNQATEEPRKGLVDSLVESGAGLINGVSNALKEAL